MTVVIRHTITGSTRVARVAACCITNVIELYDQEVSLPSSIICPKRTSSGGTSELTYGSSPPPISDSWMILSCRYIFEAPNQHTLFTLWWTRTMVKGPSLMAKTQSPATYPKINICSMMSCPISDRLEVSHESLQPELHSNTYNQSR